MIRIGGAGGEGNPVQDLGAEMREMVGELSVENVGRQVVDAAVKRVATLARREVPKISGAARKSMKAKAGALTFGGSTAEYAPWLDFGGELKPKGKRKGVRARPVIDGGRYVYPAIAATNKERLEQAESWIVKLIEKGLVQANG